MKQAEGGRDIGTEFLAQAMAGFRIVNSLLAEPLNQNPVPTVASVNGRLCLIARFASTRDAPLDHKSLVRLGCLKGNPEGLLNGDDTGLLGLRQEIICGAHLNELPPLGIAIEPTPLCLVCFIAAKP